MALRCLDNVPGAVEDLIAEMEPPLLYYALKIAGSHDRAIDLLQEVWLRALPRLRKLKDPASVRSWLYSIAHAASVDRYRHGQARERAEEAYAEATAADETTFSPSDAAAIHQALDRIDRKHREVLVLYFLEDFSLAEISQILECPQGTAKSRLFYAKKALRDALTGEHHDKA